MTTVSMNMVLLPLLLQVLGVTFGFQFKCPGPGQWRFRARRFFCPQGYVCLLQSLEKSYQETCDGIDYSSSGSKLVFEPNFNKADCSKQRYQPFPFSTEGNSNCVYQKSFCNAEGQVVNTVGSSINDTTCQCDFLKGYRFVIKPKHSCYCIPSQEDCSCHKLYCSDTDNVCLHYGAAFQSCPEIESRMSSDKNVSISLEWRFNDASNIISKGRTNRLYCFYFASALLIVLFISLPLHGFTGWPAAFYKEEHPTKQLKSETDYEKQDLNMDLLESAEKGKLDDVKYFINEGADMNYKGKRQNTPLSQAATKGHLEIVKYLVNLGCDKETKDLVEQTPLIGAAWKGRLEVVQFLCEKGSNIEARDTRQMTPLSFAADIGHLEIVKCLVEYGSDKEARETGRGRTPILWAAERGHLATLQYLVTQNCNKEAKDEADGKTALHYAAGNGHLPVTQWLIEKEGMDPLEMTSTVGKEWRLKGNRMSLVEYSQDAKTALHLAAENGALEVTKWLIKKAGIDPLVNSSPNEKTALHLAAGNGELEVTKWLIEEAGVNPFVKSSQGKTPYDFAAVKGEYDNEQIKMKKEQVMDFLKTVMIKENPDKILECDSVQQKGSTQNETQNIPPQRGVSSET